MAKATAFFICINGCCYSIGYLLCLVVQSNTKIMKVLKTLGLSILSLVLLLLVISFFLPSKVTVSRSALINAPVPIVFKQVNMLQNWEKWSPWHKIDPAMLLSYEGPDEGKGARYNWFSKHPQVGNGALTITDSSPFKRIDTRMEFEGQNDGIGYYLFEETPKGTKVIWVMEADLGSNPVGKYFGLMIDGMIGPDFEQGLENLRKVSEQPTAIVR